MNLKKLLCLVMAMMLALSAAALAEGDDLQAQLDAANARIAELEAQVAQYKPYYDQQIVAEYGEGGIIWRADAQEQYDAAASMYSQYGISVDAYADQIKQSILETLVEEAVLNEKADELGLSQLDEDALKALADEAETTFNRYVDTYKGYFAQEGLSEDEVIQQTVEYLESAGASVEGIQENLVERYISDQLYDYVTKDTDVSDEEIKAEYDRMVAEAEESYANDAAYNSDRNAGETIAWNPEGYRVVKHVLVLFDDEQSQRYSTLSTQLSSLSDELEAAMNEPEDAEDAEEARPVEDIQREIGQVGQEIEALYTELMPTAQEVIDAFNNGTDFEALIEQYGGDPGMQNEPTKTIGYAVSADSTMWEQAFTDGAMSIAEKGQISAPVHGSHGIHIIWYMDDITPGAVPFEQIADAVREQALAEKINEVYNSQVDAWMAEANPVYYLDRF